ncbi:MAG: hypothetical protein F6K50_16365 [Moorea sp. SIO3I7]|uniref:hypothetical protein n=1 Tax=unclassified Moorena TaxID=2683338 RepID=UPI0013C0C94D|nr:MULTISPECIES: hypothetical protein [unclassified Moorena]NEN97049.1 hypothetical protein [Moorena sp. SIO3I7]NEO06410.1 hypothetical protein [Moorena sp. SIO3I8]NEP22825.1 hypothetical protein [Moorena sp. SIO3I6]NEQ60283.1 hypothetical protein [Moorena sp. SIO4A1]
MNKDVSRSLVYEFQPHQIICLEHDNTRLYAEVIEFVSSRQMCWVRSMILVTLHSQEPVPVEPPEQLTLYDLRSGPDLLWPASLLRLALDTEVIPLLVRLDDPDVNVESDPDARQQLSYFICAVWQAYPDKF